MIRLMDPQMVFQIPKPTRLRQCGFQTWTVDSMDPFDSSWLGCE